MLAPGSRLTLKRHRLAFGAGDAQQAILGAFADGRRWPTAGWAAAGTDRDGDRAEVSRVLGLARSHDGDERVGVIEAPDGLEDRGVPNLRRPPSTVKAGARQRAPGRE